MHPIAFNLGPLTVHWYGVLVAIGFLAGLWTASRRAKSVGIAPEKIFDLGPWLIIGGILGGRVLYVISYWREEFAGNLSEIFMVQHGGLVFYGGLVGATIAGIFYLHLKKLPLWNVADIVAPSIALGYVFGRLGCFMNGCCYGRACEAPWGLHFPGDHAPPGAPVHPTGLSDSFLNLGFYFFLAWLFRRRKFEGQIFAMYLVGYALLRSFVEYFRGAYPMHYLGGVATPAQLVSIGVIIGGLALMFL